MPSKATRRTFKGGIGLAVAVILAWGLEAGLGVTVPGEVTAAMGSVVGTLASWIKE